MRQENCANTSLLQHQFSYYLSQMYGFGIEHMPPQLPWGGSGDSSPEPQQVCNLNDVAGLLKAETIAFATCGSTHVPGTVRPQSHGIPGLGRPENEVDNSYP